MRGAHYLYIQTIGVMPPVVKGSRGEHGNGTPDTNPAGQGTLKSPKLYIMLVFIRVKKCPLEDHPGAGEATEDASKIDNHVRR